MDPIIFNLVDKVLNKYLSYSEHELKRISEKEPSLFWKEICSTMDLIESYEYKTGRIIVNNITTTHSLESSSKSIESFNKLHNLVIELSVEVMLASNDEFYDYFEVSV